MFEDIKKNDESFVAGNPAKVEDMFGKVDPTPEIKSAVQSGKLAPVAPQAGMQQSQMPGGQGAKIGPPNPLTNLAQVDQWSKKRPRTGLKIGLSVLAALVVTGVAVAYFFFRAPANVLAPNANEPVMTDQTNEQPDAALNQNTDEAPSVPTNALIDTDGDGLTDVEETAAGTDANSVDTDADGLNDRDELRVHKTNPLLSDSDNDGLSDRDEIFTWKTNPNNQDSDGDTYQDGVEVQNGYNPNGPGKLTPAPAPTTEPSAQTEPQIPPTGPVLPPSN